MAARSDDRKQRGAWYTPPELVDIVVSGVLTDFIDDGRKVTVLDPACGDGRFLTAVGDRLASAGSTIELVGCDIDRGALDSITDHRIRALHADALNHEWGSFVADIVIGNPPFLSQMSTATTRGGSSRYGGGPYADAAVEIPGLATRLARPDGGQVGLVLPQSILGARDALAVRQRVTDAADLTWSWWAASQRHFDANVNVCAIGLQRPSTGSTPRSAWTGVVTERLGIPTLDLGELGVDGTLGDRADLNANFRDEYYALVPAVSDEALGPPLVTSGLIDPGQCHWGRQPVRFAKQDFERPRVELSRLTGRFPAWAARKLVPKVLVANQTRIIEAVADPGGEWLPGVPVTTVTPTGAADVWAIAAVLTSPVASIAAWQHGAGTGLSTTAVRVGPTSLAETPWPAGPLDDAIEALRFGNVVACARHATRAYAIDDLLTETLINWWTARLPAERS